MQSADAVVERNGDGVETHALFGPARECGEFEQRVLRFVERSDDRCDEQRDEVLYALSGSGAVTIDREHHSLATGTAVYVAKGTGWHVDEADELVLLSVLVEDPLQRTMAGALGAYQGHYATNIPLLCAGSLLILTPTLIVFLLFQRQFISALLQGSLKG